MINIPKITSLQKLGTLLSFSLLEKNSDRNYLIKTNRDNYVFTLYNKGPRFRSLKELAAQKELSEFLIKKKIPVAPIISILKFGASNILIKKHIDGRSKATPNPFEVAEFSMVFGRFHKSIQNYQTKNKILHKWDLKTTERHLTELKTKFPKDKILQQIQKELSTIIIPNNLPRGMIHEDLGKRHVLWLDGKISGLIDFERSYYAPLIYDLGQVLRGWCFHTNWKAWCNKKLKRILDNYQKERKLSQQEKKYLYPAIKFAVIERALSFYIKFLYNKDKEAKNYSLHSLNYLLSLLEKKKEKIESIINAA